MKSAKSFIHPKVGGLRQSKQPPGAFKAPTNPYRDARTAVTKVTGGKTKPMGKF